MNAITQDFITALGESDVYWTFFDFFDGAVSWPFVEDEADFACQELYGMQANEAGVDLRIVTDHMRIEYENQRSSHYYDEHDDIDEGVANLVLGYGGGTQSYRITDNAPSGFIPQFRIKELPMSIEDVTLVNGVRADNLSDEQLFDLIRQEKAAAKNLEDLPSDSKAVQKRKADIAANIARLVKLVDERQEDSAE